MSSQTYPRWWVSGASQKVCHFSFGVLLFSSVSSVKLKKSCVSLLRLVPISLIVVHSAGALGFNLHGKAPPPPPPPPIQLLPTRLSSRVANPCLELACVRVRVWGVIEMCISSVKRCRQTEEAPAFVASWGRPPNPQQRRKRRAQPAELKYMWQLEVAYEQVFAPSSPPVLRPSTGRWPSLPHPGRSSTRTGEVWSRQKSRDWMFLSLKVHFKCAKKKCENMCFFLVNIQFLFFAYFIPGMFWNC